MASDDPPAGRYAVTCEIAHGLSCNVVLRADKLDDLLGEAMQHGAQAHGFTPAFYDESRRKQITSAAKQSAR